MEAKTIAKIATKRKELHDLMEEQKPKIESAKVIVAELKKIGVDTSELDNLLAAVDAFTANTSADTGAGSDR